MEIRKNSIKHSCPCCENFTYESKANNTFQICPVCFWEDDGVQQNEPDYEGGANEVSLNQARTNYKEFGAIEKRYLEKVRPPLKEKLEEE